VEGTFTPTEQAKTLSIAPHFNSVSTPLIARFSVGGGGPELFDVDDKATPKGLAIRFQIDNETHTDLISHSFDGFATRTGEEFLAFLQAVRAPKIAKYLLDKAKDRGGNYSKELENFNKAVADTQDFLDAHPSAATFANSPKPNPFNYGTITYYQPTTHVLTNKDGKVTNVRYRLDPADGDHLYPNDPKELNKLGQNYLEDDLRKRFPDKPIVFTIVAHIAEPNDVLDDSTVPYKSTTFVSVGKLEINKVADDNAAKQQQIAFSPAPERGGIKGIASSNDPLIRVREGVYWISADQRRNAKQVE
jgi:catalase